MTAGPRWVSVRRVVLTRPDRMLLLAALLLVIGPVAAERYDGSTSSGGAAVLGLLLLWAVRRGNHPAWVVLCSLSALGVLLPVWAGLADLLGSTVELDPDGLARWLFYAALLAVLLSRPVRLLVGRARVPDAPLVDGGAAPGR